MAATTKFAGAIMKEQYADAYAMTSSHLRSRMTPEQFTQAQREARQQYGKPLKLEIDVNALEPASLAAEGSGFPDYVPPEQRQARLVATMAVELDGQGNIERGCDLWVNWVTENGQDKVAGFQYMWAD